jgi:hypothetical protein
VTITGAITFTGTLSNGVVSGTITFAQSVSWPGVPGTGGGFRGTASGSFPISAR